MTTVGDDHRLEGVSLLREGEGKAFSLLLLMLPLNMWICLIVCLVCFFFIDCCLSLTRTCHADDFADCVIQKKLPGDSGHARFQRLSPR